MRTSYSILLVFWLSSFAAFGQWSVELDDFFSDIEDSSRTQLSFGNIEQNRVASVNLGAWYGFKPADDKTVHTFSENTHVLFEVSAIRGPWRGGVSSTLYNFNSRSADSEIFNAVFNDSPTAKGSYSYSNFSSVKHTISLGRRIKNKVDALVIFNGHQFNSSSNLFYTGAINNTDNEISAIFRGSYHSSNSHFIDSTRGIAVLPLGISATDSSHLSTYRDQRIIPSLGFYLNFDLLTKMRLSIFGNHIGGNAVIFEQKQDNSYSLELSSTTLEVADLLSSTGTIIRPTNNYSYSENRSSNRDTSYTRTLQPTVFGTSLVYNSSPSLQAFYSFTSTRYHTFFSFKNDFIVKKTLTRKRDFLFGGLSFETIPSFRNYANLTLGGQYNVAERLTIHFSSRTAPNFSYLNQSMTPKSIARMHFRIGAKITLP